MTAVVSTSLGTPDAVGDAPHTRSWLLGFAAFAVIAGVGLAVPVGSLGWRILALVVIFHLGVVILARRTGDAYLWRTWSVLAPLSIVMVLPDWFLSAVLGTLEFPDTGGLFIGTVPLFMAGMWTIALMPVVLVGALVKQAAARREGSADGTPHGGEPVRSVAIGAAAAAGAGLLMFWAAELVAPSIPIWQPVDVASFAGVAAYVLLPEAVLSAAAFVLVATAGRVPRAAITAMVILLPFTYTGMLATSYQFLG